MLGGVAAGLADYMGVDPIVFRAAFVVLTFLGGIGIFLYLLAWLMIPPDRSGSTAGEGLPARLVGRVRGRPAWVGVILLAIGGALVAHRLGVWHPTVFWGVTLVVAGIILFREDRAWRDGSRVGVPGAEPSIPPRSDAAAGANAALARVAPSEPKSVRPTLPATAFPVARAPRWPFGSRQAAPSLAAPDPSGVLRARVVGAGDSPTCVGLCRRSFRVGNRPFEADAVPGARPHCAWCGTPRRSLARQGSRLILPGILLIPLVLLTSLVDVPIRGGFGNRYINPRSVGELHRAYELTAGELVIDLTSLTFGSGNITIDATVAAGRISVLAPETVSILARAHAGAGSIDLFGQSDQGVRVDVVRTSTPPGSLAHLVLNLETGIGRIAVYREQFQAPAGQSGEPSPVPSVGPSVSPSPTGSGGG